MPWFCFWDDHCLSGLLASLTMILFGGYVLTHLSRLFSPTEAAAISVGKTLIFALYFLFFYDMKTIMNTPDGCMYTSQMLCHYPYWGYAYTCRIAARLLGGFYASPVAFNTLLSVFIALLCAKVAGPLMQWKVRRTRWFFLFCCFHPEMFVWSSMYALKDTYVCACITTVMYCIWQICNKKLIFPIVFIKVAARAVLYFREYVVSYMASSIGLWVAVLFVRRLKYIGALFAAVCALETISPALRFYDSTLATFNAYGNLAEFFLRRGGEPFSLGYLEILLGAWLQLWGAHSLKNMPPLVVLYNLATIPLLPIGLYLFVRENRHRDFAYYFLLFFCIVVAGFFVYTVIAVSPRHRFQVFFATTLFQFLAFQWLYRNVKAKIHAIRERRGKELPAPTAVPL
ncbi:MAG: hypothetical protein LBJ70_01180 [Holosporales bacterium]|nr:hypothetical protein [Holosporales bacterium]